MVNPNRFYTYAYLRVDRTPYYIGKGQTGRIYQKGGKPCGVPRDKSRIIFLKKNLTEEEAFKHEIYMIDVFGRIDLGTGILHNKTNGGEGCSGWIMPDEVKKKIGAKNKGNKNCLDRKISEETKRKISEANTGNVSYWKGKKQSKETIEKMKLTKKMKGDSIGENNPRAKKWKIIYGNGTEEIIKSLQTWARKNGYNPSSLRNFYNGNGIKKYKDIVSVQEVSHSN
jgi:hypothetical protein